VSYRVSHSRHMPFRLSEYHAALFVHYRREDGRFKEYISRICILLKARDEKAAYFLAVGFLWVKWCSRSYEGNEQVNNERFPRVLARLQVASAVLFWLRFVASRASSKRYCDVP